MPVGQHPAEERGGDAAPGAERGDRAGRGGAAADDDDEQGDEEELQRRAQGLPGVAEQPGPVGPVPVQRGEGRRDGRPAGGAGSRRVGRCGGGHGPTVDPHRELRNRMCASKCAGWSVGWPS
ncbi:hypothetical protein [Ornithinimicrobium kibberense]|uniref:hypothetical protein n=1 Tax=Ornithinimicrobium kibberense TaxID=282060 RepID=UPI003610FF5B